VFLLLIFKGQLSKIPDAAVFMDWEPAVSYPILIAPSILAADFTRLGEQIAEAERAGADSIHIDVMDERFVPNITMGPLVVEAARRVTSLPLEAHLMIVEPERHIPAFLEAGASVITVHVETCPHLHRTLEQIHDGGAKAAVTLNPATPASAIQDVLPFVDMVLVMTVNPGFGGQSFISYVLQKIRQIREMSRAHGYPIDIQVDGGIDTSTAPQVVRHGANALVAGTSIFHAEAGITAAIAALRQAAQDAASI